MPSITWRIVRRTKIDPIALWLLCYLPWQKRLAENVAIARSAHRGMWHITPPQADISVFLTLVTNCNHAWSQGNYNFYLGQISFVFCGIYQSISYRLQTENVYLGK